MEYDEYCRECGFFTLGAGYLYLCDNCIEKQNQDIFKTKIKSLAETWRITADNLEKVSDAATETGIYSICATIDSLRKCADDLNSLIKKTQYHYKK